MRPQKFKKFDQLLRSSGVRLRSLLSLCNTFARFDKLPTNLTKTSPDRHNSLSNGRQLLLQDEPDSGVGSDFMKQ